MLDMEPKSHTKRFTGYKAGITETVSSRFITSIKAIPGNRHDGETAVEAITEQRSQGLIPPKVIGILPMDMEYIEKHSRKTVHKWLLLLRRKMIGLS